MVKPQLASTREARRWSGDIVVSADEIERRTRDIDASVNATSSSRPRRCVASRKRSDSMHEFLARSAARPDRWSAPDPRECRRLLRPDWTLCADRVGLHDDCHRLGGGCADGDCVLDTVPGRWRSCARAVCYEGRGRRIIMTLGGVQAIATRAYGLFAGKPADIIAGPGNKYVAEAKRVLFGLVGIDVLAGPTEVPSRRTSGRRSYRRQRPRRARRDMDTSRLRGSSRLRTRWPTSSCSGAWIDRCAARHCARRGLGGWRDYGEVVLCGVAKRSCASLDRYAAEHLEVHAKDLDWWLASLTCYGSLFLGEGDHGSNRRQSVRSESRGADAWRSPLIQVDCPYISSSRRLHGNA